MAFKFHSRMGLVRACLFNILSRRNRNPFVSHFSISSPLSLPPNHSFTISASLSTSHSHTTRFKPMCLYHTQGKCTKAMFLLFLFLLSIILTLFCFISVSGLSLFILNMKFWFACHLFDQMSLLYLKY